MTLKNHVVSQDWKLADVTLIFKKGGPMLSGPGALCIHLGQTVTGQFHYYRVIEMSGIEGYGLGPFSGKVIRSLLVNTD